MAFRLSNWGGRELLSSREILTLSSSPSHGGGVWAIIGIHACLVWPRTDLENEIAHKNVQEEIECDPCAISSCETNLMRESAFNHERGKE